MNMEQTEKFLNDFVGIIKSRFPNSYIYWKRIKFYGTYYHIKFFLCKDESEVSNKIMMNDALNWCFIIDTTNEDGTLKDEVIISLDNNTICRIADKNDPKEKYCVYGRVKVPFRKIKGNVENCLLKLKKFIDKTAELMVENQDVINQGVIKGLFTVNDKIKN
jgi:hypothetical protein